MYIIKKEPIAENGAVNNGSNPNTRCWRVVKIGSGKDDDMVEVCVRAQLLAVRRCEAYDFVAHRK